MPFTKKRPRSTYIVMDEDGPIKVVESATALASALRAAKSFSDTGKPMSEKHLGIQALVRAKFAERGITVDSLIDTFEDARTTALNRDNFPDHKVRMEAAKTEALMMGLIGVKEEEKVSPTTAATFTAEELKGKSNDEIVASVLRKLQIAQSKGSLSEEDVVIRPEQVESLSKFSQAAVGNSVEGNISLRTRPDSRVTTGDVDAVVERWTTREEDAAELLLDEIEGTDDPA